MFGNSIHHRARIALLLALTLITTPASLLAATDPDLSTVLATSPLDPQALQKAIANGADPNTPINNTIPLVFAIKAASDSALTALLAAGADTDASNASPLRAAITANQPALLLRLLQFGADTELPDDAGNTPLLLAIQSNSPDLLTPLLNFGADPTHKNKSSQSVLDLAAAAHPDLLPLLQSRAFHPAATPLNIIQVTPADDLVKLAADAPDFSTLQLAPGTYTLTQLQLTKTLTLRGDPSGKSIITSPDAQTLIYLHNTAHLWLDHVTLKVGGKTEIGLFIDSGSALVTNCLCDAPPKAAFYSHAGSLVVINSRVTNAASSAIGADSGAFLTVRSTTIQKSAAGIIANGCSLLAAFDNTLDAVDIAIQSSAGDCASQIRRNRLEPSTTADSKTTSGIDVIGGKNITIENNRLANYAGAISVTQDVRAPAIVRNNFIANPQSGIHIAIAAALPRPVAVLENNQIYSPKMAGIFSENTHDILLKNNTVVSNNFPAVILQEKSHATFENNTIISTTEAVGIRATPPDTVSFKDDAIAGERTPDLKTSTQTDSLQQFAAAVACTPEGQKLLPAAIALCNAFDRFSLQHPESANAPLANFNAALAAAHKAQSSLASLTFKIKDCADNIVAPPYNLYQYLGGELGHAQLTPADFHGPSFFITLLQPKDPLAKFLHDSLPPELLSTPSPDLAKLIPALNDLLSKASIYAPERFTNITLKPETQRWLKADPGKDPAPVFQRLNRYLLEDAYPDALFSSRPLSTRQPADPIAFIPAGNYFAVPVDNPELLGQVTLIPGEKKDLVVPSLRGLWVHVAFFTDAPQKLFTLRSDEIMRATYSRYRILESGFTEPLNIRPNLSPAQTAAALAAARKYYPAFTFRPDLSKLTPEQAAKSSQAWWMAQRSVFRILQLLGTPEDVTHLIADGSSAKSDDWYQSFKYAYLAAAIEARLGLLSHSQLSSNLQTPNPLWNAAAAVALHHFGIRTADPVIRKYLAQASTKDDVNDAAWVLSDDDSPETLTAIRTLTAKYQVSRETRSSLPTPLILHLLVYGNAEDRRHAVELPLDPDYDLGPLFPLTDDPKTTLEALVNDTTIPKIGVIRSHMYTLMRSYALRDAFPANRLPLLETFIQNSFYQWGYAHPGELNSYNEREGGDRNYWDWQYVSSPVNLNDHRAARIYENTIEPADPAYYGDFEEPKTLEPFTSRFDDYNVDFVPHDHVVAAATPQMRADFGNDAVEAYLAAHAVSTTENTFAHYVYDDGLERRAFTLCEPNKASIFCLATMKPTLADNALRTTLTLSLESHFVNGAMFGIGADPIESLPIYPYLINGHQALIKSVRLITPDSSTPPTELHSTGANSAFNWTYEGPLPNTALDNRFLDVELQFFNQHTHLLFNLSTSNYAHQLRILAPTLAAMEATAKSAPNDLNSWLDYGALAASSGKLNLAWQAYQHALSLQPANLEIPLTAADMFYSAAQYDPAINILQSTLKTAPDNHDLPLYLGTYLFTKGDYKSAAAVFQNLPAQSPDDPIAINRVLCSELAGDHANAIKEAQPLLTGKSAPRALAFWFIAAKSQNPAQNPADALNAINQYLQSPAADPISKTALTLLTGQSNPADAINQSTTPVNRCRFNLFAGLNSLYSQKNDDAAAFFTASLATGQQAQPEYRLAAQHLAALKGHE